ncbi:hypothetical protein [Mangrovimonas sp. TPBH4]|uniref:hypothetical protein n=1 Tax=Mangrovimonas sp. TPBH4 TaxID=1645914 RepID=UPI0006B68CC4|nr:hypothetical protein [Mangrovimonas sp. TPBH4]
MKNQIILKPEFLKTLFALLTLFYSFQSLAKEQQPATLENFTIVIEEVENGIKQMGIEGTAWLKLSFSLKPNQPQAVDQYGMSQLSKDYPNTEPNLVNFLFTITKTENWFILKGIKGTAWTDLRFTLPASGKQAIDESGTLNMNLNN